MANEICLRGGRAQLMFRAKASYLPNASNLAVKVVMVNGKEGGVNVPLSGRSRVDTSTPNRDMFLRPRPTHQCPPPTTTPFSMRHKEDLCGGLCAVLKMVTLAGYYAGYYIVPVLVPDLGEVRQDE
jgi:hypothetical protein